MAAEYVLPADEQKGALERTVAPEVFAEASQAFRVPPKKKNGK
jgi:hypothetical protein